MNFIEGKLYRLSQSQLRALFLLAKSSSGIISSTASSKQIGKKGKALGGVFSSLSRQVWHGQTIVIPWGRSADGRGLRWKLNEKMISKNDLLTITKQLLEE
jgi:hypothetical protein